MAIKFFSEGNNLDLVAKAIPSAISGYYDAKDREARTLELEAKKRSESRRQEREQALDRISIGKKFNIPEGVKTQDLYGMINKGELGSQIEEFDPNKKLQAINTLVGMKEKGYDTSQLEQQFASNGLIQSGLINKQQGLVPQLTPEAEQEKKLKLADLRNKVQKSGMSPSSDLRKEWVKDDTTKNTKKLAEAYNKIISAATNPSAAGDLALVFNYMKMLDPGSVVRESEFANAAQARGALTRLEESGVVIPAILRQSLQKLENGEFLLPEQRQDFSNQATNVFNSQMQRQNLVNEQYNQLAKDYGIDPGLVVRGEIFEPMKTEKRVEGEKIPKGLPSAGKEIDLIDNEDELDKLNKELDMQIQNLTRKK